MLKTDLFSVCVDRMNYDRLNAIAEDEFVFFPAWDEGGDEDDDDGRIFGLKILCMSAFSYDVGRGRITITDGRMAYANHLLEQHDKYTSKNALTVCVEKRY